MTLNRLLDYHQAGRQAPNLTRTIRCPCKTQDTTHVQSGMIYSLSLMLPLMGLKAFFFQEFGKAFTQVDNHLYLVSGYILSAKKIVSLLPSQFSMVVRRCVLRQLISLPGQPNQTAGPIMLNPSV